MEENGKMFIKIVNRRILLPPVNDGNHFNVHLDSNWLKENGFFEVNEDELEKYVLDLVSSVHVYSRNKIVDLLGDKIEDYFHLLKEKKLLVDFITADSIPVRSERFSPFFEKIEQDHPGLLDKCIL